MYYRHTQMGWVILLPVLVAVLVTGLAVANSDGSFAAVAPLAILVVVAALFISLTVEVDDQALRLRFGVGLVRRTIALADIASWQRVRNPWYIGWGIRNYGRGLLYNVAGFDAVEVHLRNGSQFRVGTNDADGLCAALSARLGAPAAATPESMAATGRAQRRFAVGSVVAVLAAFAAVAVMLFAQTRPIKVTIDAQAFVVDDPAYDVRVPWSDVTSLELVPQMPHMSMRTNGLAMGGILRGHFRSPDLGPGRLYVDTRKPPFVLLRTGGKDRFIVVNLDTPGQTQGLFTKAMAAWQGARSAQP